MKTKQIVGLVAALIVGVVISFIPPSNGLTVESMRFAGIFLGAIIMLLTGAMLDWITVLFACVMLVIAKVGSVSTVFAAFSSSTVWLIIMVFVFAVAIGKTGLLTRIALKILSLFPRTYKGAVVALMTTGIVVSPLIPSVNAKVNILIPLATSVTEEVRLKERSRGALGLFSACYLPAYLGGNAFISGSAYVAFILGFITDRSFNFLSWFAASCIWFVAIIIGTFIWCMTYCKPSEDFNLPETFYSDRLKALGPMSKNEKLAAVVLICCLILWSTSSLHHIDTGMIGWTAIVVFALSGIITTQDFCTKVPWSLVVFLGGLFGMAGFFSSLGWNDVISGALANKLALFLSSPWIFIPFLCVFTYLLRFVIIEQTPCLLIMLAIFAPLIKSAGISLFVLVFVEFMSSMVWNVPYQNVFPVATLQVAGGKYVTFQELKKDSYMFMLVNLIGMILSIPLWMALGLIF